MSYAVESAIYLVSGLGTAYLAVRLLRLWLEDLERDRR